jgi:phosphoglucomutase
VGTAIRHNGSYVLINGNQMGILLFDFICKMRKESGRMPQHSVAIKTIVTTEMAQAVANQYGVELINVLTGFKFIGEQIGLLERRGEEGRFVFGFEESYGYLAGSYVRDKDAVVASMLICQMAACYKKQGLTLVDAMDRLYNQYGFYFEKLESFTFEGISGMETMQNLMKTIRENPPVNIGGLHVQTIRDYFLSRQYENGTASPIQLPSSDVMGFFLEGGSSVIVRPSGTEPKLKVYYSLVCADQATSWELFLQVSRSIHTLLQVPEH